MQLVFVTSNPYKAREATEILQAGVQATDLDLPEIQAVDLKTVAREKARAAHSALGEPEHPVLVEDSGIVFEAWDGLPGALTKWFVKSVGNEGLLRMLSGFEDRSARAVCVVAVARGPVESAVQTFTGEVAGSIASEPRGSLGFGWDPIFIPATQSRTYAELGARKHEDSHRSRAFRAARDWLERRR